MTYSQFRKQQHSFQSSEGNIKYIDVGEGDVIVLLHGVPTSGWLYRKMINELAKNYRVIAPDMLGFGASDSPKGYDIYQPKAHATRLLALMNHLKISKWHHVFHDAGGLWTWELLKQDPDRIKTLIILNTIIYEEGFQPPIRFQKGFFARCIMALYSNGISTNTMLNGLFKTGLVEHNLSKEDLQGYKKPLLEGKTKAMYHFFSTTCNDFPDYTSVFDNLQMPKYLIWGKEDTFLTIDNMYDKIVSKFNLKEEDITLLNAKHFIQEEKPKVINDLILDILSRQST